MTIAWLVEGAANTDTPITNAAIITRTEIFLFIPLSLRLVGAVGRFIPRSPLAPKRAISEPILKSLDCLGEGMDDANCRSDYKTATYTSW